MEPPLHKILITKSIMEPLMIFQLQQSSMSIPRTARQQSHCLHSIVSEAKSFDMTFTRVPAPTNVQVVKTDGSSDGTCTYTVTWNSPASDVDSYRVYCKMTPTSEWSQYGIVDSNRPLTYTLSNVNSSEAAFGNASFAVCSVQKTNISSSNNYSKKVTAALITE